MSRARFAVLLGLFAAGTLPAQSLPPLTKSKEAAKRAVEATNAHTATMTANQDSMPVKGARPAASADSTQQAASGRATQSAGGSTAVPSVEAPAGTFDREVFSYQPGGRRDPFVSLMATGELAPALTDLQVTGIVYDASGQGSVAVLRDQSTKEQYRVRVGQSLGRIRVARIDPKAVTFTIEEFGFSRQETLALRDSNKERTK
jgi:hypothetical protein